MWEFFYYHGKILADLKIAHHPHGHTQKRNIENQIISIAPAILIEIARFAKWESSLTNHKQTYELQQYIIAIIKSTDSTNDSD